MGALGYRQVVAEAMPTPVFVPPLVPDLSRRQWLRGAAAAALLGQGLAHAQQRPEKPRLTLALGGKTALYYLPLTIAEQLKYFSAEGLEVDLQDHAGDSLAQQALLQGQADLAAGGFERVILLRQHGVNCRAFAALADFTAWSRQALAPHGVWLAMKGRHPQDEIDALPGDVQVFHVEQLTVPGLQAERCIVWLRPVA